MPAKELLAAQAVLAAAGLILYLEARLLLHAFRHRAERPRPQFWPGLGAAAEGRLRLAFHAAALLLLACLPYGFLAEPRWVEVRTVRLTSPAVSPASGVIRIVQLSDLHSEAAPLNEPAAAGLVRRLKADLVVVTGDYINSPEGAPTARRLLSELAAPAGVFCVTGNYDLAVPAPGLFDGLPVRRLDRSAETAEIRGSKVRVIGFDVGSGPYFRRAMAALGPSPGYDILLHHYSDLAYEAQSAGIDLYLSGHTHGGQVRLPFYGALITLATFGKRFENGLYRLGDMSLFVNRGLGLEGGGAPRVRFLCRPEITLFELSHGPGTAASHF